MWPSKVGGSDGGFRGGTARKAQHEKRDVDAKALDLHSVYVGGKEVPLGISFGRIPFLRTARKSIGLHAPRAAALREFKDPKAQLMSRGKALVSTR